jgi:hypothetical protein
VAGRVHVHCPCLPGCVGAVVAVGRLRVGSAESTGPWLVSGGESAASTSLVLAACQSTSGWSTATASHGRNGACGAAQGSAASTKRGQVANILGPAAEHLSLGGDAQDDLDDAFAVVMTLTFGMEALYWAGVADGAYGMLGGGDSDE